MDSGESVIRTGIIFWMDGEKFLKRGMPGIKNITNRRLCIRRL
jgi:hypothetical protein